MSTYRMDDGTVVKTENAIHSWEQDTRYENGHAISIATGSEWDSEKLYRSRKGRYWLEHTSTWQGRRPYAEWVGNHTAAAWLLANGHALPDDLQPLENEVAE